jgi:DNA-binding transcriptional regulator YiaG
VRCLSISHIGKETHLLEAQEERVLLIGPQAVYLGGGEWETIRPWLYRVSISKLSALSGVSQRMLRDIRQGKRRPSGKNLEAIMAALVRLLDDS